MHLREGLVGMTYLLQLLRAVGAQNSQYSKECRCFPRDELDLFEMLRRVIDDAFSHKPTVILCAMVPYNLHRINWELSIANFAPTG